MKRRWLIVLAGLACLATLVLHAPAAVVYAPIIAGSGKNNSGQVRLYGTHGTLSHGGFAALELGGRSVLTDVRWDLNPAWLALLRVSADLEARGETELTLKISRALFGRLRLSDVDGVASIKSLLGVVGQPRLPVAGQVRLAVDSLQFVAGQPVHVEGTAGIQGLTWTLAREPLLLGDFSATLSTDSKGILAALSSGPGPLELTGEARLAENRSYELHLQIKPRATASAQLQSLIRSLGQPDGQGWYHIRRQGTL